ncbi:hypothetical protein DAMA08_001090 [Martiniozyma asiatica (nom. inval.)]|nr:hypothetical protein DAMA08_001090 [Martiniozyma asiatica]
MSEGSPLSASELRVLYEYLLHKHSDASSIAQQLEGQHSHLEQAIQLLQIRISALVESVRYIDENHLELENEKEAEKEIKNCDISTSSSNKEILLKLSELKENSHERQLLINQLLQLTELESKISDVDIKLNTAMAILPTDVTNMSNLPKCYPLPELMPILTPQSYHAIATPLLQNLKHNDQYLHDINSYKDLKRKFHNHKTSEFVIQGMSGQSSIPNGTIEGDAKKKRKLNSVNPINKDSPVKDLNNSDALIDENTENDHQAYSPYASAPESTDISPTATITATATVEHTPVPAEQTESEAEMSDQGLNAALYKVNGTKVPGTPQAGSGLKVNLILKKPKPELPRPDLRMAEVLTPEDVERKSTLDQQVTSASDQQKNHFEA